MEKEDRRANVCRRNSPGPGQEAQEKKILSRTRRIKNLNLNRELNKYHNKEREQFRQI